MAMHVLALLLAAAQPAADETFSSLYRHTHYFLVWNDSGGSPKARLESVSVSHYADRLSYQVIDAANQVVASSSVARGSTVELASLPASKLYLVQAEPGLNGVRFAVDRPYGIVADARHRLGLNAPRGRLFFYVPAKCAKFRVVALSESPREGARVQVHGPDGALAGAADGELDTPAAIDVAAPEATRGRVWSLLVLAATTPGVHLDDVNVHLEGKLACLVTPRAEWASQFIPQLPESQ